MDVWQADDTLAGRRVTDIKVLSTHAVQQLLCELALGFEHARGMRLRIDYDPANALRRKIEGGAEFDVAIVTRPVIDTLAGQRRIVRESCVDIARSGLGIAIRRGAGRPEIATIDTFRQALLAAKSIVRSKEGTSGVYFETLLARLGLTEAMRDRVILGGSGRVAELVARGEAEMAVQQIPELLPVAGVDFAGPLPPELQLYTVFSAGIGTLAKNPAGAREFIGCLVSPDSFDFYAAKGLEPMSR